MNDLSGLPKERQRLLNRGEFTPLAYLSIIQRGALDEWDYPWQACNEDPETRQAVIDLLEMGDPLGAGSTVTSRANGIRLSPHPRNKRIASDNRNGNLLRQNPRGRNPRRGSARIRTQATVAAPWRRPGGSRSRTPGPRCDRHRVGAAFRGNPP